MRRWGIGANRSTPIPVLVSASVLQFPESGQVVLPLVTQQGIRPLELRLVHAGLFRQSLTGQPRLSDGAFIGKGNRLLKSRYPIARSLTSALAGGLVEGPTRPFY